MAHDGHHHHHHSTKNLGLAFGLNLAFAIIEVMGGLMTNSVAILSDALHDFGDAMALLLALVLEKVSRQKSDHKYSYGYRRYSPLAAVITGVVLIIGSALILIQAIPRIIDPVRPQTEGMMAFAVLGVVINGFAAFRVSKGSSLNEKMITWHLIEDVMGWVLVLISAVIMHFGFFPQLDAILACLLALWIVYNVFRNLRQTLDVFLQAHPTQVDQSELHDGILKIPGVLGVHHSHIWSLDGEHHIFTSHVVIGDSASHKEIDAIKTAVKNLAKKFHILESTVEIEFRSGPCPDPHH